MSLPDLKAKHQTNPETKENKDRTAKSRPGSILHICKRPPGPYSPLFRIRRFGSVNEFEVIFLRGAARSFDLVTAAMLLLRRKKRLGEHSNDSASP